MTPSLHCASMLMSLSLRRVTFALQEETTKKESEASQDSVQDDDELTIELDVSYKCKCIPGKLGAQILHL